ncbi:MAG TPA: hypothetical protein VKU94_02450 [Geobacterales bacterium]|nr:hypothetical protein [Geobacterales bacterium]
MATRTPAHRMPFKRISKRATSKPSKRKPIRQASNERLSNEDKAALEEIMAGKAEVTTYDGEEYIQKLRAMINESA